MKYMAIIFDFDGVIFDSERIHLQAYNQVLHKFGITISEQEYFEGCVGLSDREIFEFIFKKRNMVCEQHDIKSLRQDKVKAYKDSIHKNEVLEGIKGLHKFIKSHMSTVGNFAICSGSTREEIGAVLDRLEGGVLKKYFKHIITRDNVERGKPFPDGYLLAAKSLEVAPSACLAIEDTSRGIEAARRAGMDVAGLTTSYDKNVLKGATFVVDTYETLGSLLDAGVS